MIALAVPFPPPGRAVAVLFLGIDAMAQAVIDAGLDGVAQDDSFPPARRAAPAGPADPA